MRARTHQLLAVKQIFNTPPCPTSPHPPQLAGFGLVSTFLFFTIFFTALCESRPVPWRNWCCCVRGHYFHFKLFPRTTQHLCCA